MILSRKNRWSDNWLYFLASTSGKQSGNINVRFCRNLLQSHRLLRHRYQIVLCHDCTIWWALIGIDFVCCFYPVLVNLLNENEKLIYGKFDVNAIKITICWALIDIQFVCSFLPSCFTMISLISCRMSVTLPTLKPAHRSGPLSKPMNFYTCLESGAVFRVSCDFHVSDWEKSLQGGVEGPVKG